LFSETEKFKYDDRYRMIINCNMNIV